MLFACPISAHAYAPFFQYRTDFSAQVATQLQQSRNYAAKEIQFGSEGRASMQRGVERLANAVQVTLGPKVSMLRGTRELAHMQHFCRRTYTG